MESDFDACMRELLQQKEQIERMKQELLDEESRHTPEESENELVSQNKQSFG